MQTFHIKIKGTSPYMQHKMPEDELFKLLGSKTDKKVDKAELTPRQVAERHVYKMKDGTCYIPAEHLSGAFAHVASDYKQKHSVRKSLKTVAKGIFRPVTLQGILRNHKNEKLKDYEVDIRKATNHQKGAVAVCRPRFDEWQVSFDVAIDDTIVNPDKCLEILNDAGRRAGMGSFRVARGGYHGQFVVTEFKKLQ